MSKSLSGCLDELGFDRRRIRERIHVNNRCSRAKDISTKRILKTDTIEKVLVGSIREGIGMNYSNDTDILQINHAVICKKDSSNINEDGKVVFKMVCHGAAKGYTYLKLLSKRTDTEAFENLRHALIRKKCGTFLSSKLFMTKNDDVFKSGDGIISKNTCYKSPEGPSIPKYVEKSKILRYCISQINLNEKTMDFVRAFPCTTDSILEEWSKRDRNCGWPSEKTIAHVLSLPAHVVPVGQKDSINADLQWRICFNMAEIHLIQAFNNIQTKVFVLMKLIAKHILQPLCKDITSYIVKTVMLWFAEKTPQKKFRKKHLLSRLADAIHRLKNAVQNKCLPSYMIPKRNLFVNKISKEEQHLVVEKLNSLLQNGTQMLNCYFHDFQDCSTVHEGLQRIYTQLYITNRICKYQTCVIALFTTQQLASYYTNMFACRSWSQMFLYNVMFILPSFLHRYGFTDPLSFQLSDHFAISERQELKKLELKKSHQSPLCIEQSTHGMESNLNVYIVDKFGVSFGKLVLSSLLLLAVFLYTQNIFHLILKAMDSDGIESVIYDGQVI